MGVTKFDIQDGSSSGRRLMVDATDLLQTKIRFTADIRWTMNKGPENEEQNQVLTLPVLKEVERIAEEERSDTEITQSAKRAANMGTNSDVKPRKSLKLKRNSWTNPPDKPKRPLSAYNIFFQLVCAKLFHLLLHLFLSALVYSLIYLVCPSTRKEKISSTERQTRTIHPIILPGLRSIIICKA